MNYNIIAKHFANLKKGETTMTIVKVATLNQAKIEGITDAFEHYFKNVQVMRYDVKSGVPSQPVNNQVFEGARNRLLGLKKQESGYSDYWVACESGLINLYGFWFNFQVVMIMSQEGKFGVGVSQGLQVPPKYVDEAINTSIAKVLDRIFKGKGGVRLLTYGKFTRKSLIKDATIMAITRMLNGDVW